MIAKEDLTRIARMSGMKPHQQEKHYIQTQIIRSIYSMQGPVFKGGTALMFRFGLDRFSEDLDFTNTGEKDPDDLMEVIREDLGYLGIETNLKVVTDNDISLSFRIGAEGPLFQREIERCYVRIEVSRRESILLEPETFFMNPQYPDVLPFSIIIMDREEIMAEKVRTILARNKARDVYDLWFLITERRKGGGSMSREEDMITMINNKLDYCNQTFKPAEFHEKLREKEDLWKAELDPIIFGQLPEFKDVMKAISLVLPIKM